MMSDRVGRMIDGKPRIFDVCDTCKSEVELDHNYDGTFLNDPMKDPDVSGSYRCGKCGTRACFDFTPRAWIHELFNKATPA